MPCQPDDSAHRRKLGQRSQPFNACVARPVNKTEIASAPAAQQAMKVEWDRLRAKHVWDETIVREWDDVANEARQASVEANLGYLFGLCTEKNSEQPLGHPSRKYKGRVVLQGNRVVSQNWQRAIFEDLGNAPATMDASRAVTAMGVRPATPWKWPTRSRRISKLSCVARLAGSACHPTNAPRRGRSTDAQCAVW